MLLLLDFIEEPQVRERARLLRWLGEGALPPDATAVLELLATDEDPEVRALATRLVARHRP